MEQFLATAAELSLGGDPLDKSGRYLYTGLPSKIVRNFFSSVFLHLGFLVEQNWLISVINYLVKHKNTELHAETKS